MCLVMGERDDGLTNSDWISPPIPYNWGSKKKWPPLATIFTIHLDPDHSQLLA